MPSAILIPSVTVGALADPELEPQQGSPERISTDSGYSSRAPDTPSIQQIHHHRSVGCSSRNSDSETEVSEEDEEKMPLLKPENIKLNERRDSAVSLKKWYSSLSRAPWKADRNGMATTPGMCAGDGFDGADMGQDGAPGGWAERTWSRFKNRWPEKDVIVVLVALFIIEGSRGLVLPTMYTYVVQNGGDLGTLGVCISLYSVGRLVCSVPFGTWADKRSSREVLVWSSVLGIFGNALYSMAPWMLQKVAPATVVLGVLCASRLFVGFGTGSLSVCKAYLAANSPPEERTKYIAWSGMAQYAGFSITPGLATLLMYLEGSYSSNTTSTAPSAPPPGQGGPTFLACVLPGIALVVANATLIPALYSCMPARDPSSLPQPQPTSNSSSSSTLPAPATTPKSKLDDRIVKWGFALFFFLNLVLRGVIGVIETLAPKMYQHLRSDQEDVLEESGRFFFFLGLAGLVIFALVDPIQRKLIKGDHLLVLGTACVAVGTLLNIDDTPDVEPAAWTRFVTGMVLLWSIGSPICQTLTVSMFSKMLGRRPQGGMIGWITTAGSLGRILFPTLVGLGPNMPIIVNWIDVVMCGVCAVGVYAYAAFVKKMRKREDERQKLLQSDGEEEEEEESL